MKSKEMDAGVRGPWWRQLRKTMKTIVKFLVFVFANQEHLENHVKGLRVCSRIKTHDELFAKLICAPANIDEKSR